MDNSKAPWGDDWRSRLREALPASVRALGQDIEILVCEAVQATLQKLNVVTREEFDAQTKVLERTREKIDALAHELAELEKKCP